MSGKLKILICGVLPPPHFGHSKIYEMLMASVFPRDHDVRFLNMHFWSYETNKKVTVRKFAKLIGYYLGFLWLIVSFRPRYVLYNISFYQMPFLKDLLFCGTAILWGRRVVFHDLGQYVRELHERLPGWQKPMLRWMLKHSAASIVMGENVKQFYQGLMDPDRLFAVPGVVEDTKNIDVVPLKKAVISVLYFSHMSAAKGIFVAYEAAETFLKARADISMVFGGPMESDQVAQGMKMLQSHFPGRVAYLGYVDDIRERTRIFREADIFIFPTLRDVFGLVLLHAMAEKLPIVASREGCVPETIVDGQGGFLVPKGDAAQLADKVLRLADDPNLRHEMGMKNYARYQAQYLPECYGRRMVEVFIDLDRLFGKTPPAGNTPNAASR